VKRGSYRPTLTNALCGVAGALTIATVIVSAQAPTTGARVGSPLPGLTPVEFEEFRIGLEDFLEVETADDGAHVIAETQAVLR